MKEAIKERLLKEINDVEKVIILLNNTSPKDRKTDFLMKVSEAMYLEERLKARLEQHEETKKEMIKGIMRVVNNIRNCYCADCSIKINKFLEKF